MRGVVAVRILLAGLAGPLAVGSANAQFADWVPSSQLEQRAAQVRQLGGLRIVNGQMARQGDWPFAVLLDLRTRLGMARCGGSLIAPTKVLTAAHCVWISDQTGTYRLSPDAISVRFGHVNLNHPSVQRRAVREIVIHDSFDPDWVEIRRQGFDLAILTLDAPLAMPTIMLASAADLPLLTRARATATVIGWGQIAEGRGVAASHLLLQANVPLVDLAACRESYPSLDKNERVICAGAPRDAVGPAADACQGDSGGPLFTLPAGARSLREVVQIGVVSWGEGCGQPGKFGVYESVAAHEAWIRQHAPEARFTLLAVEGERVEPVAPGEHPSLSLGLIDGPVLRPRQPVRLRLVSNVSGFLVLLSERRNPTTGEIEVVRAMPQLGGGLVMSNWIERGIAYTLPPPDREWHAPVVAGRYTITAYLFASQRDAEAFAQGYREVRRLPIRVSASEGRQALEARVLETLPDGQMLKLQVLGVPGATSPSVVSRSISYEVR